MPWKRASDLGARLRAVREVVGRVRGIPMTQQELGEVMGLTGQSVSDAENGRTYPSRSRLDRLAKQLGIPLAVFQEGGPMPAAVPIRLPETRTETEPSPAALDRLHALERRLRFFRLQLRSYAEGELRPGPAVIAEWEELLSDLEEARKGQP